jgi:hypothetical protein
MSDGNTILVALGKIPIPDKWWGDWDSPFTTVSMWRSNILCGLLRWFHASKGTGSYFCTPSLMPKR